MMNVKDYRIGNLVEYDTDDLSWQTHEVSLFDLIVLELLPDVEHYRPIPITEEWLQKLGFSIENDYGGKDNDCKTATIGFGERQFDIYIERKQNHFLYWLENGHSIELKYVHQLQNLYHSLFGDELSLQHE